jgi:ABC-type lipoprotein export system ATPase subunit
MNILMEVVEEREATLVVVTHDTSLSTLGDRVLTIKDGIVVDD